MFEWLKLGRKLPFCIDLLSDPDVLDVGKIDIDHRDNFHYDDNFNYVVVYRSLIKKKGQEITIKCRKEECKGPYQVGDNTVFVLRPSSSYYFGAIGVFDDDTLGNMIEMIINECNGHIKKDQVQMSEIDKETLLNVLKKKYMKKIKDRSIKLLSKSFMGRMVAGMIHEHERVKVDRDILQGEINRIEQTAQRAVSPTARDEVLTEGLQTAKAIKDTGITTIVREAEKKKA